MKSSQWIRAVQAIGGVLSIAAVASGQTVAFTDVTASAGLSAETYTNPNNHGLCVNWIDIDNDGWVDLFATNSFGSPCHLYRNNGAGAFTLEDALLPALPNVTYTHSNFGDFDRDGDQDIYLFADNEQWDPVNGIFGDNQPDGPLNLLLKNQWVENGSQIVPGQPLFVDVAAQSGVTNPAPTPFWPNGYLGYRSFTGGWLDYDRDGWLDLFVGNMCFSIGGDPANANQLYRNAGDGTFTDVSVISGVDPGGGVNFRPSLAFIAAHLDSDLWPDMYVVNVSNLTENFHYDQILQNSPGGSFTYVEDLSPGVGQDAWAGMGVDVADIDLDGTWDLYITDLPNNLMGFGGEGNPFYLGNGDGTFQPNSATAAGVFSGASWGTNFFDVDHDGFEDLYVVRMDGADNLYLNNQDGTFTDIAPSAGITTAVSGRGSAIADYDRDGDLDIVTVAGNVAAAGTLTLWRNDSTNLGNSLELRLVGVLSNRDAIGARVTARYTDIQLGPMQIMRQVKGGSGGHGQDDFVVHLGVGRTTSIDEIVVDWPSGACTQLFDVTPDQLLTVTEPNAVICTYCTPKPSSAGCIASISTSDPAAWPISGAADYSVTATAVQGFKNGLLFGGTSGPAMLPFSGGTLCVTPPNKRSGVVASGGSTPISCDGSFAVLVNDGDVFPSGLDAGTGNSAWYQFWYRDPLNGVGALGTALSNAVQLDFQ